MLLLLMSAAASAQPEAGQKLALLVGVQKYAHPDLATLKYSENDVAALGTLLTKSGYQVTLLSDSAARANPALAPTKANIEKTLTAVLARSKSREDTVLIAFAGHGLQFQGQKDAYFCPQDARPFAEHSNTLVSLAQVYSKLEQSYAGIKMLLVDACRNDPKLGRGVNGDTSPRVPRGVGVLFSCAAGEVAYEDNSLKHGVFFHFVLEGLRGQARNMQGQVTFTSLADYVSAAVAQDVPKRIGQGAQQSPNLMADFTGATPVLLQLPASVVQAAATQAKLAMVADPLGRAEAQRLGLSSSGQPRVSYVVPGGGADKMGLRQGDIILRVNGRSVASVKQYTDIIKELALGGRVDLVVLRDGQTQQLTGTNRTDLDVADELQKVKAQADDPAAARYIAAVYWNGQSVARDAAEAAKWHRKAADSGERHAQFALGAMYESGQGVSPDIAEAARWYRKAADQGDAESQKILGTMHYTGRGVAKSYSQAAQWYRKAAEQGHAVAQNNLGLLYNTGVGVSKNSAEAQQWFRKAAEQGFSEAQCNLGVMYSTGRGVVRNDAEAVRWFRRAAEQGSAYGQNDLGQMYEDARGVARSYNEAVRWYAKSADQGCAAGQYNLGRMYQGGVGGLSRNLSEAIRWYRLAAAQGNASAQRALQRLGQK
jgi:TPR repeat protein